MKHLLIITALLLFCCPTHAQHPDTIKVYFDLGKPTLSSTAKQLLDSLAYYDILPVRKKYGIIGYADYIGSEESNITLSKQRAASAEQYLLGLGVKKENIETVTGKGEVSRESMTEGGYPTDRRVDIVIGGFITHKVEYLTDTNKKICRCGKESCRFSKKSVAKQIDLSNIKKGESFNLDEIFFEPGNTTLLKESMPALETLYNTMAASKTLKIQIEGHVHCGFPGMNTSGFVATTNMAQPKITPERFRQEQKFRLTEQKLSEGRAAAIYTYLADRGIETFRMKHIGLGCAGMDTHPDNNRRVEIRILNK